MGIASAVLPHLRKAAHYATDRATEDAYRDTQARIRGVGLGKLAQAVGRTSSLKKRRTDGNAWGAIYAKGGRDSRANQALMSYTEGALIRPTGQRKWLAYPTKAAGRVIRLPRAAGGFANFRNLPRISGHKLDFIQFSGTRAALVLKNASVSMKTGKAKAAGKRIGRGAERRSFVVMFWLIRSTVRTARYDQGAITLQGARGIPRYVREYQTTRPL